MVYVSTFITGTENIIKERLIKDLTGAVIVRLNDGIVFYHAECGVGDVVSLRYLNNTFIMLAKFTEKGMTFEKAVDEVCSINFMKSYLADKDAKTFRVMFSDENTFINVKEFYRNKIELNISRRVRLKLNKSKPDTEFWFLKRSEGMMLFLQRVTAVKAKKIQKGRLRSELADTMCYLADVRGSDTVCDPFAGYGAIPDALLAGYRPKRILCADVSAERADEMVKQWQSNKRVTVKNIGIDGLVSFAGKACVDKIITDPPWGVFDDTINVDEFYAGMTDVFASVLKPGGRAVLLTDRRMDIKKLLSRPGIEAAKTGGALKLFRSYEILVNGKKANINVIIKQ